MNFGNTKDERKKLYEKIKKYVLLILLLAIVMIMPTKVNAEEYAVFKIKFTVQEPVIGETPAATATVESGTYTATVNVSWYESTDGTNWTPITTTTFENAKYYAPYISLTMDDVYYLLSFQDTSVGGSIAYYINDEFYMLESHDVKFSIGLYQVIDNTLDLYIAGNYTASSENDYTATLKAVVGYKIPETIQIKIENTNKPTQEKMLLIIHKQEIIFGHMLEYWQ